MEQVSVWPKKVVRHFGNGRAQIVYRYANGFEGIAAEGSEKNFWLLVKEQADGCWRWTGRKNNNHNTTDGRSYDYGTYRLEDGSETGAHRAAVYYLSGRRVPDDLDLTSLCGDELCVNPAHRGVVDKRERVHRKESALVAAEYFALPKAASLS